MCCEKNGSLYCLWYHGDCAKWGRRTWTCKNAILGSNPIKHHHSIHYHHEWLVGAKTDQTYQKLARNRLSTSWPWPSPDHEHLRYRKIAWCANECRPKGSNILELRPNPCSNEEEYCRSEIGYRRGWRPFRLCMIGRKHFSESMSDRVYRCRRCWKRLLYPGRLTTTSKGAVRIVVGRSREHNIAAYISLSCQPLVTLNYAQSEPSLSKRPVLPARRCWMPETWPFVSRRIQSIDSGAGERWTCGFPTFSLIIAQSETEGLLVSRMCKRCQPTL